MPPINPGRTSKYILSFTIEPAQKGPLGGRNQKSAAYAEWAEACKSLISDLPMNTNRFAHEIDVESPGFGPILDKVENWTTAGLAHFGYGRLTEVVDRPGQENEESEWFWLNPSIYVVSDIRERDGIRELGCLADKMMPGRHFRLIPNTLNWNWRYPQRQFPNHVCVSDSFYRAVEKHQLRGLRFFYLPDFGKYEAGQWHLLAPTTSLGRGVDHPWVDPGKYFARRHKGRSWRTLFLSLAFVMNNPEWNLWRHGIHEFDPEDLRKGAGFGGGRAEQLFKLYDLELRRGLGRGKDSVGLDFIMEPRVLRKHLPKTDFAYFGESGRLFLNRRALNALKQDGVFHPDDFAPGHFGPVEVLDAPPRRVRNLDKGIGAAPPRHWSAENLAVLAAQSEADYSAHLKHPKPKQSATIEGSLALMEKLRAIQPDDFREGAPKTATDALAESLGGRLPKAWRRMIEFSGEIWLTEMDFTSDVPDNIMKSTEVVRTCFEESNGKRLPENWISFGYSGAGDSFIIDLDTEDPATGDAVVKLITHEGYSVESEWPSLAAFLQEAVEKEMEGRGEAS